jgi:hypothetical protein
MVVLYLHSSIHLLGIVLNCIVKYRIDFAFMVLLQIWKVVQVLDFMAFQLVALISKLFIVEDFIKVFFFLKVVGAVSPKFRCVSSRLYSVISHKTLILIFATVRSSSNKQLKIGLLMGSHIHIVQCGL